MEQIEANEKYRRNFGNGGLETSFKKINDIRNWKRFQYLLKMGDVVDVAFDDFNRCCNGCQIMMGGENNLHKIGETTNPNKMWNRIFFWIHKNLGPDYLGFWDCWNWNFT